MRFEEKIIYIKKYLNKKYSVIPPVKVDFIEKFEKENSLELPKFYRYFITNIALGIVINGEAYPFEEDILTPFDFETILEDDDMIENPKIEFPLTKAIYNLSSTEYDYFDLTNGTIFLKGTGCGNGERLIINGKAHGQVWIDEVMSNDEIYPAYKSDMPDDHFKTWINKSINSQFTISGKKKMNPDATNYAIQYTVIIILVTAFVLALAFQIIS
ncbi:hypothetical protein [Olleya sp. R77988]|uniref:hypothetical protein n=1 Tax=Olleya sp. R77988 TaxID=3093875 RepID=UPI0037CB8EB7